MDKNDKIALVGTIFIVLFLLLIISGAFSILSGLIFFWLWNWIAHGIFKAPHLTYWQSVGLVWLISFVTSMFRTKVNYNKKND